MNDKSKINQELVMSAVTVAKADTHYSDAFRSEGNEGQMAVLVVSTAGSITITQQVGLTEDGTFYDAVDQDGTALGPVISALTVTTGKYIAFSSVLAPYSRFKVVEGNVAETVVTITVLHRTHRRN